MPRMHLLVDPHRAHEPLAAVDDPMPDRLDVARRWSIPAPDASLTTQLTTMLDGRAMIAQRLGAALRRAVGPRSVQTASPPMRSMLPAREPLVRVRRHALGVGAHELELERRRAGVEDEDVHDLWLEVVGASPEYMRETPAEPDAVDAHGARDYSVRPMHPCPPPQTPALRFPFTPVTVRQRC